MNRESYLEFSNWHLSWRVFKLFFFLLIYVQAKQPTSQVRQDKFKIILFRSSFFVNEHQTSFMKCEKSNHSNQFNWTINAFKAFKSLFKLWTSTKKCKKFRVSEMTTSHFSRLDSLDGSSCWKLVFICALVISWSKLIAVDIVPWMELIASSRSLWYSYWIEICHYLKKNFSTDLSKWRHQSLHRWNCLIASTVVATRSISIQLCKVHPFSYAV